MSMPVIQSSPKPARHRTAFPTWLFVALGVAVVLLCTGILGIGFWNGGESTMRAATGMRLKQMMLALHNYHDQYNSLPPAIVTDDQGQPLYSGRVLLLPFLEEQSLYERFDKTKAWNSPENQSLSQRPVRVFQSPKRRTNTGSCNYVFVSGAGSAFPGKTAITLRDVPDGMSATVFALETAKGPTSWAEPVDWDANSGPIPPGLHSGVTYVGLGDGVVMRLRTTPPHPQSKALCTIAGGEDVPQSTFVSD